MPIPKSPSLANTKEDQADHFTKQRGTKKILIAEDNEILQIKVVKCCNDFVAILQIETKSMIQLTQSQKFTNEGVVIGVGPGLATNNGARCPSQLEIGDRVSFHGNPSMAIDPQDGVYFGKRIVIYPERSIICKLDPIKFEIISGNE